MKYFASVSFNVFFSGCRILNCPAARIVSRRPALRIVAMTASMSYAAQPAPLQQHGSFVATQPFNFTAAPAAPTTYVAPGAVTYAAPAATEVTETAVKSKKKKATKKKKAGGCC